MNPTNGEIASLIILTVAVVFYVIKLLALSYEAHKRIPGSFDVDWGKRK